LKESRDSPFAKDQKTYLGKELSKLQKTGTERVRSPEFGGFKDGNKTDLQNKKQVARF
jgi:hypothetical protein